MSLEKYEKRTVTNKVYKHYAIAILLNDQHIFLFKAKQIRLKINSAGNRIVGGISIVCYHIMLVEYKSLKEFK